MKKKLIIVLCSLVAAVTLVVVSVMGTVAYLTSSSAVSNVFTVGNVHIVMDESKVDENGVVVANGGRVDTNTYKLVPGKQYTKDPQIHVDGKSVDSYLFVIVRNDLEKLGPTTADDVSTGKVQTPYLTIAEQMKWYGWREYTTVATGKVYVYAGAAEGNAPQSGNKLPEGVDAIREYRNNPTSTTALATLVKGNVTYNLFDYFYVNSDESSLDAYGGAKITLSAIAIQTTNEFGVAGTAGAIDNAWAAVTQTYSWIHTAPSN